MTVSNQTARIVYTGNGTTDTYAFPFKIFEETDLVVTQVTIATGAESELVLNTDYTITADGDYPNSGSVVLTAGNLSSSYQLVIQRQLPYTQETDYTAAGPFPAQSHENALDKVVMMVQQIKDLVDRVLIQSITATDTLDFPALELNKFLSNDGSALVWSTPSGVTYAGTFTAGTDASKAASPSVFDIHFATDTFKLYICGSAGVWTEVGADATNLTGRVPRANMALSIPSIVTDLGNSSTSVDTDASLGDMFHIDATDNFTLENPTNAVDGQKIVWRIKQDGTGSRVITLGSKFRVSTDINSGSVVLSTGANAIDYLGAIYNGDDDKFDVVALSKDVS